MKKKAKSVLLVFLLLGFGGILQYCVIQLAFKVNSASILSKRFHSNHPNPSSKVINLMFLKTHKTASSTITSILNRFTDLNDLDIALPYGDENVRFDWPEPFRVDSVEETRLKNRRANILCNHAVFSSRAEFQQILYPETRYITILRHPVQRFESLFFFENFHNIFSNKTQNPLLEALDLDKHGNIKKNMTIQQLMVYTNLFRNGLLFDLTGTAASKADIHENELISQVEEDFDLVLIAEYFDEGLVLLRKMLNWSFLDLVYEKKNVRKYHHPQLLTLEVKSKILAKNKADTSLYEYFLEVFSNKVRSYGDQFDRHLEIFREINAEINTQCKNDNFSPVFIENLQEKLNDLDITKAELEIAGRMHDISRCFCVKLHRGEAMYVKYFKDKFKPYHYLQHSDEHAKPVETC